VKCKGPRAIPGLYLLHLVICALLTATLGLNWFYGQALSWLQRRSPRRQPVLPTMRRAPGAELLRLRARQRSGIALAFDDKIEDLFKTLFDNLAAVPVTHQTDQACLDAFARGLDLARKAKQLALSRIASA
jgi:hypothetical protein